MQCSSRAGYLGYSLLLLTLCAGSSLAAQTPGSPTDTAPPAQQAPETTPQAQAPGAASESSSQAQPNYPNEQERARLAREAQDRARARRAARTQAAIQDTYSHKYDFYFGYAYLRARPGHFLQHTTEYGWNAGLTDWVKPKLGLTLDFRGYYSNAFTGQVRYFIPVIDPTTGQVERDPTTLRPVTTTLQGFFKPFISHYSVMIGPEYAIRRRKNYAVSLQGLAGVTYNLFNASSDGKPGYLVGLYDNGTRFTAAASLPVDVNLGPGLAIRIAPTYNLTTWKYRYDTVTSTAVNQFSGSDVQHNLGFTTGLTYRFGR